MNGPHEETTLPTATSACALSPLDRQAHGESWSGHNRGERRICRLARTCPPDQQETDSGVMLELVQELITKLDQEKSRTLGGKQK